MHDDASFTPPERSKGRVAVLVGIILWSLGNLAVRGSTLDGAQLAFWRYLIAAAIYGVIHLRFVGPLRLNDFRRAAPAGLAIALEIAFFFMAIKSTTIANTTVIGSMLPLLLFAVAARRFGETVSGRLVASTVVGLGGVGLVVFGSSQSAATWSLTGDLLAVVALVFFAAYFAFAKSAREHLGVFTLQTHSMFVGVPVLAVITLLDSGEIAFPQGAQWWQPLLLIALPGTGHLLVNWAHSHVTLTYTSMMVLLVPVLSVIGAWLLFDERVSSLQALGIVVAIAVLSFAVVETRRINTPEEPVEGAVAGVGESAVAGAVESAN